MPNTPVYGWPYQGLSDPPNGAVLGEGLALGIEATLQTQISTLQALIDFVRNKPAAELRQTVAQSISDSTWTSLTFTTEDLDTDPAGTGGHSTSVNTSRYTAVYAGWYLLGGGYSSAVNATGQRGTRWAVNGLVVSASRAFIAATAAVGFELPARMKRVFLNVGDYVELQVWQNSGAPLNTDTSSAEVGSSMSIAWDRTA